MNIALFTHQYPSMHSNGGAELSYSVPKALKNKNYKITDKLDKKEFKKVIKEVKIPEQITIQELSNRMAEKSNDIIKFLFNMKVVATINHNIDKDTAE